MTKNYAFALFVSTLAAASCNSGVSGSNHHDTVDPNDQSTWCDPSAPSSCAAWCNSCNSGGNAPGLASDLATIGQLLGGPTADPAAGCAAAIAGLISTAQQFQGFDSGSATTDVNSAAQAFCSSLNAATSCGGPVLGEVPGPLAALNAACSAGDLGATLINCWGLATTCQSEITGASPLPSPSSACDLNGGNPSLSDIANYCMQNVPGTSDPLPWPTNVENAYQGCVNAWKNNCGLNPSPTPTPTTVDPPITVNPSPTPTPSDSPSITPWPTPTPTYISSPGY